MSDETWILYGANGYTGELIATEARRQGLRPILAGRTESRVRAVADRLGLDFRIFPLADAEAVARELNGVALVFLAAGPFSATSAVVVEACIRTGCAYVDITGEIDVFEYTFSRADDAKRAGSVLLPGAGFDVVPSDCLAASLKEALPDADTLELAFAAEDGPSAGTAKTMIENLPRGSAVRRDGRIVRIAMGSLTKTIPFRQGERLAVAIPWGDIATAYRSTSIPNICVYVAVPSRQISMMKRIRPLLRLAAHPAVQRLLKSWVERSVKGPTDEQRRSARSHLWGRVSAA